MKNGKAQTNDIYKQLGIDSDTDSEGSRAFEGEFTFKGQMYIIVDGYYEVSFDKSSVNNDTFDVTILEITTGDDNEENVTNADLITEIENSIETLN